MVKAIFLAGLALITLAFAFDYLFSVSARTRANRLARGRKKWEVFVKALQNPRLGPVWFAGILLAAIVAAIVLTGCGEPSRRLNCYPVGGYHCPPDSAYVVPKDSLGLWGAPYYLPTQGNNLLRP